MSHLTISGNRYVIDSGSGCDELEIDFKDFYTMVKFLEKLLGSKSDRDIKAIKPVQQKVLEAYEVIKNLSNDELRAKTVEFKEKIAAYIADDEKLAEEIRVSVNDNPDMDVEEKEKNWKKVDDLEKQIYDKTQEILNVILPEAFSVVKETAKRFSENKIIEVTANDSDRELAAKSDHINIVGDKAQYSNKWIAGGNLIPWDMVHYDVQLMGGVVLHQGKIAEIGPGRENTSSYITRLSKCLTGQGYIWLLLTIISPSATRNGWERFTSFMVYQSIALINTSPIPRKAKCLSGRYYLWHQ